MTGQIYNMFGLTVYKGDNIPELIEIIARLNYPLQNAGLYRLRIKIRDREIDLVPLDAVKGHHLRK